MSLNVSRRNFMKLSAAAALAVAGSSLLTGCSDPNKPTRKGDGTITITSAKTTVERAGNTFKVTIKNGRQNDLVINARSFNIVTESGKEIFPTIDKEIWSLQRNEEATVLVTVGSLPTNEEYTFRFRPDANYTEIYAGWIYGTPAK